MILKNSFYKYDRLWVIGDIRLAKDPTFHVEAHTKKTGYVVYENVEEYMKSMFVDECQKNIYYILDEHIRNGTEILTCHELAVQYCIRLGMFDDEYRKSRINAFVDELKAMKAKKMSDEKDGVVIIGNPYGELDMIGGDPDNISTEGMEFVEQRTYENLINDYVVPKHILPSDKMAIFTEFFQNLRFAVTKLIQCRALAEITE